MRKLMWFSVGFAAACALGAYFDAAYFLFLTVIAFVLSFVFIILCRNYRYLRVPVVLLLSFAVGTAYFYTFDNVKLAAAEKLDASVVDAELAATDFAYSTDYGSAVNARFDIDGKQYNVLVYLNETIVISPGDCINGTFRFRFTSIGGNDEPTYHRSEGVFLLAYQSGEVTVTEIVGEANKFYPSSIRLHIIQWIERIFPQDTFGFAKALLIGDRSGIDYETNTAFRLSGISHIIAVSGLHVSILFSILYIFFGRRRLLLCVLGFPVLLCFAAITGYSPSVVRACIMQGLMFLALLVNREYDPPTALGAAALIMLIVNPMVIVSISFQLSVGCMIGIFAFSGRIHGWLLDDRRLGKMKKCRFVGRICRGFSVSVSVSIGASIITTPLVAVYFEAVSLVSLITNLLIVWVVSFIFYGVLFACLTSFVSLSVGRFLAALTANLIRFVIGASKALSAFPLAAVYTKSVYIVLWLVFIYISFIVFLCIKKKPVLVFVAVSIITLCASLMASWMEPMTDECRVTVLDVGQGQCILLQSDGKTYMVDCGGSSATKSADIAADTLLSQGIQKLDGLIVTHFDEDHAGGVPYLLSRIPADHVFLPDIADEDGICERILDRCSDSVRIVCDDLALRSGSAIVTVFGPESYNLGNESCLCVLFQTQKCDILITGDRGELGEQLLLHRTQLPELEVLIAGHHGSAASTGEALLSATNPEYVLISVGDNSYGHPAVPLLQRLQSFDCKVFRTDYYGTIVYRG